MLNIPNAEVCYYDSDKITILSNLAKQKADFLFDYGVKFNPSNDNDIKIINEKYFGYLLHSIKEDKPHFYDIINPYHLEKVFAAQVKLDNPRIIRQSGAFLVYGIKKNKYNCAEIDDNWILNIKKERLIIPSRTKKGILDELDSLGINKSTLFPELEVQASYFKKKYNNKI